MGLEPRTFALYAFLASVLIVITFIDIDHRIIPDVISKPGMAIGFAASWLPGGVSPASSAAGLLLGGGLLAGAAWLYAWWTHRGGLGLWDVKLLAMIGAFLGWTAVPATMIVASLSGSAVGIPAILVRGRHLRPRDGVRAGTAITAMSAVLLFVLQWMTAPANTLPVPGARELALAVVLGALTGLLVTVRLAARRYPIPFGPFLALGALVCIFLKPEGILAFLG